MKLKQIVFGLLGASVLMSAMWKPSKVHHVFYEDLTLIDKKIKVSARVYSSEESEQVLRVDLTDKGYVPVEVTIQNQGDHAYTISMASTALRSDRPKDVAWKYYKNSIPRAVGWRVLSFFFWPFMVPSTIDSVVSFKKNRTLLKSLTAKGFKEIDEIVLPYSLVKRLLYIPEEAFYKDFSVSMEDLNEDELVVIPVVAT